MNGKVKQKRKMSFLTKLSILLFLVGLACFVLGIVYAFDIVADNTMKMVGDDFDDLFKLSDFQQVAMCFFTGFVFMVWAGVLLVISRVSHMKKLRESQEQEHQSKIQVIKQKIQESQQQKTIICAYCDSELEPKDRKCPHCGSSKKIVK